MGTFSFRSPYEQANKERYLASDGRMGLAIVLPDHTVFYSRGWYGCDACHHPANGSIRLHPFTERRGRYVTTGWRCTG